MILYVSATSGSNLKLAKQLQEIGEELSGNHQVVDLAALNLPLFSSLNEKETPNETVQKLSLQFKSAKAFVFCAPEYNGSTPPVLSNALAWLSKCDDDWRDAFNGKFAAIATHSGGPGFKIMQTMGIQLQHLGITVLGRHITTNYAKSLNEDTGKQVVSQLLKLSK